MRRLTDVLRAARQGRATRVGGPTLAVTDRPDLLAAWSAQRGTAPATVADLTDRAGRDLLAGLAPGTHLTVVLAALSCRTVDLLAPLGRRAADVHLVLVRGLARRLPIGALLDAWAPQLLVVNAGGGTVAGRPSVWLHARAPGPEPAEDAGAHLAALAVLGVEAASWQAAEAPVGPRTAVVAGVQGWVDGMAGSSAVDAAWAHDAAALRRASPQVVLTAGGDLAPELDRAVSAARTAGAVVLTAGPQADGGPDPSGLPPLNPATVPVWSAGRDGRGPLPLRTWQPPATLGEQPGTPQAVAAAGDLLAAAARGEPVLAPTLPAPVADLLGAPLTRLLRDTAAAPLEDPTLRERHGVRVRRAAMAAHSVDARWRQLAARAGAATPAVTAVSVLLATRRPDRLDDALAAVRGQTHRPLELVVALHGIEAPPGWQARAQAALDGAVTLVTVPASASLGAALNAASAAAAGQVLTKFDDDDLYGPHHVADLLLARRASAATLIGRGAEFYYLEASGRTLRRVNDARERPGRLIAGSTLTIDAADLAAVGGWQDVPARVDRRLVGDVERHGGVVYRTHGFGHVIRRHRDGHTWQVDEAELAHLMVWQAPGLRTDVADVDR